MKHALYTSFLFVLVLSGCTQPESSLTPAPEELITNPIFAEQVKRIDRERIARNQEPITTLIERGEITKIDNGTEPIVFDIPSDLVDEEKVDENGDLVIPVSHDRQQVEEYYQTAPLEEKVVETEEEVTGVVTEEGPVVQSVESEEIDKEEVLESVSPPAAAVSKEAVDIVDDEAAKSDGLNSDSFLAPLTSPRPQAKPQKEVAEDVEVEHEVDPLSLVRPRARPKGLVPVKVEETVEMIKPPLRPKARPENLVVAQTEEEKVTEATDAAPLISLRPKERPKDLVVVQPASELVAAWDGRSTAESYTKYTLDAIKSYGGRLLKGNLDDKGYCPNYNNLSEKERVSFWLLLVSLVAKHESGFNTNAKYKEKNGKYSRGLLQLGFAGYKNCNIRKTSKEDRHNPQKNLECGVVIMNHWAKKDKMLRGFIRHKGKRKWRGSSRYWSVLREEIWSGAKRRRLGEIKRRVQNLSFCRK